ncbi:hypothetical protein GCM10011348_45980 [Marinobacterium nitratireducens]|uniref:Uncharacterized protein n=1 Tax=Marinobacterium nitratireducens TaxID=518897 RepID=A0A918DYK7_9GAMM|nr:hypothetical protein [Marinobacterium nitratireducens]GGO89076.1 hypothetical protein GCM10011348_45980 [Marinobacterium nitratireducens]
MGMSYFFRLPVRPDDRIDDEGRTHNCLRDAKGYSLDDEEDFAAAAFAINHHDDLVEALRIAVGSIEEICQERGVPKPNSTIDRCNRVLAEADRAVESCTPKQPE